MLSVYIKKSAVLAETAPTNIEHSTNVCSYQQKTILIPRTEKRLILEFASVTFRGFMAGLALALAVLTMTRLLFISQQTPRPGSSTCAEISTGSSGTTIVQPVVLLHHRGGGGEAETSNGLKPR